MKREASDRMYFIIPVFLVVLSCLIYLGYQDLKTREINIAPLVIVSIIGFLYFLYVSITNGVLQFYLLQIGVSSLFLIIIYLLGKITIYAYIGEGDLIAILAISLASGVSVLFAPFVFLCAMLLMLLLPIVFLVFNLIKGNYPNKNFGENIVLMVLGFPKKIETLNNFYTPLEKFKIKDKKIVSEIIIRPNCAPDIEIKALKNFAKAHRLQKVWVSPLIPFIISIVLGYVIVFALTYFNVLSFLGSFAVFFM